MAVISVAETWNDRRADISNEEVHYERVFKVITNNTLDDALTVMVESGIPLLRAPYIGPNGIYDLRARCTKVEPRQDQDDPRMWIVRCYYERKRHTGSDKPWQDPPEISIDGETEMIYLPVDNSEPPIPYCNSAGEMFSPPIMTPITVTVITIKDSVLTFDPTWPDTYQNSTNAVQFFGAYDPGTVLLDKLSGETKELQDTGLFYWKRTAVFKIRDPDWILRVPDVGMKEIGTDPVTGNTILIPISIQGVPVANPYPLDGQGHKAVIPSGTTPDKAIKLIDFTQYPQVDWTPLGYGGYNVDSWQF